MKSVHLARGLSFPAAELATKVTGAFGGRGSGKTSLMGLVIEQLLDAKIQVIVLDPIGLHYALRLAADGKHPSPYQIPVLGGAHGDIPLESTTGGVVGRALALSNDSCVLDISQMRKAERVRFSAAFFEAFYEGKKANPAPVLLCLEEAQNFAPQIMYKGSGQEHMLGAVEDLAAQGRNFGAGLWLNTLRPQKVNKEVTSLMDIVFGFKLTGVHERKAVRDWLQEKGADGRDEIDGELPSLQPGHAFVWSPSAFNVFGKYHMNRKATYDAGATPLYARAKVKLKPLNLDELKSQMAEVVEQSKANDPRALKARIAELEREAAARWKSAGATAREVSLSVTKKTVLKEADLKRLERCLAKAQQHQEAVVDAVADLRGVIVKVLQEQARPLAAIPGDVRRSSDFSTIRMGKSPPGTPFLSITAGSSGPSGAPPTSVLGTVQLSKCARALLAVLASRGVATDSTISALSGYRKTSSGFANALSELRTRGLIDGSKDRRTVTEAGRALAGDVAPPPTGPALLDYWLPKLGKCEGALLKATFAAGTISRQVLADATGYSITSSGFANGLSGLRTLDLIQSERGNDNVTIANVFRET